MAERLYPQRIVCLAPEASEILTIRNRRVYEIKSDDILYRALSHAGK